MLKPQTAYFSCTFTFRLARPIHTEIGVTMPKIMKRGIVSAVLAIACVGVPGLRAQQQKELLPAPLPAQIYTARKVFLSNAGDETLGDFSGGPDRAYNQLYAALKGWGRYEVVAGVSGGAGCTVGREPLPALAGLRTRNGYNTAYLSCPEEARTPRRFVSLEARSRCELNWAR